MYLKFLISLVLPFVYILLRNHLGLKELAIHQYHRNITYRDFWSYDLLFIAILMLNFLSISSIVLMDIWVIYYAILCVIYIRKHKCIKLEENKDRYFSRLWRMDIIYFLLFSYVIFMYQEEKGIFYYCLIGLFIYLHDLIMTLINEMLIKMENYKNGSEKYEN